jgi:prepilin-type N-terminal cleavage/methylation domain-containing protein
MLGKWAHNERGLTLIEVLAAMTVLCILIFVFVDLSHFSAASEQRSSRFEEALRLAEAKLALAKSKAYTDPASLFNAPETEGGYTIIYQLTNLAASPEAYDRSAFRENHVSLQSVVQVGEGAALLTVTVTWGEADG